MRGTINRPITPDEMAVIRVTLERAAVATESRSLGSDLDHLRVVERCGCGCDTVEFAAPGLQHRPVPIADGTGKTASGGAVGIIIWGTDQAITGIEVYGIDVDRGDIRLSAAGVDSWWVRPGFRRTAASATDRPPGGPSRLELRPGWPGARSVNQTRQRRREPCLASSTRFEVSCSRYKALAEAAIAQLDEADLSVTDSSGSNSIAVICWHIAGNLRSRFTDFLTSDGEKPWRHRDEEFEERQVTREALLQKWNAGWDVLVQGARCAHRRAGPRHGHHPRAVDDRSRGAEPLAGAPQLPCRPDRLHRQGAAWRELHIPQHPTRRLGHFPAQGVARDEPRTFSTTIVRDGSIASSR